MYLLLTLIGWAIGMVQGFFLYYVCRMLWKEGREFDNEETPKANNMNYCPQCGKILEEAPECWEEAE